MLTSTWSELIEGNGAIRGPARLTIGTFDGIHVGHREILYQLTNGAGGDRSRRDTQASCAVLTFRQHPRAVLTGHHPGVLTTTRQRHEQFAGHGVTHVVLIDFSTGFSRLTGREFVGTLRRVVALKTLVVGEAFRCGRGRDTDVEALRRLLAPAGVRVVAVPPVIVGGSAVSSTRIRAAVREGDVAATQEMMGRPFEVDLRAVLDKISSAELLMQSRRACSVTRNATKVEVPGSPVGPRFRAGGREFFVAAEMVEQLLPRTGVYSVSAVFADGDTLATLVEVTDDGLCGRLPEGIRELPLGLRFHRRVRREVPGQRGALGSGNGDLENTGEVRNIGS